MRKAGRRAPILAAPVDCHEDGDRCCLKRHKETEGSHDHTYHYMALPCGSYRLFEHGLLLHTCIQEYTDVHMSYGERKASLPLQIEHTW